MAQRPTGAAHDPSRRRAAGVRYARGPSASRPRGRSEASLASFGALFRGDHGQGLRFALFVALIGAIALLGGSSWPNTWSLLLLRPLAILLVTAMLLLSAPLEQHVLRGPALLLAALAVTVAIQLIPLPPALWSALPGHAPYLEAAAAAGLPQPWRPITLSLDLTLNSLVALTIPAAVVLGGAALRPDQRDAMAGPLLGVAVSSALLGLLQITLGPSLYPYARAGIGRPSGLFVNINHQAAVLAAIIPVAAAWAVAPAQRAPLRAMLAAAAGVLLFVTVLVSGSRTGLALAGLSVVSIPLVLGDRLQLDPRLRRIVAGAVVALLVALVATTWLAGRLGGLDRLLGGSTDQRVTFLPITLALLRDFAPFGSGYGTFDAVFRHVEPDAILKLTYFNHAHNDLLELGITGGVAALLVAAAYVLWLVRRGTAAFGRERRAPGAPLARAAFCASVVLLIASLTDYPLRTPLAAGILALASVWLADRRTTAG